MRACPFCGYDEGWTKEQSYAKPPKFRVECNKCGAVGPEARSHEMAEKKWDGLLAKINDEDKFEEALREMDGAPAGFIGIGSTPGMGNAQPASSAAMTGAQQTSSDSIGSGDKWDSSIGKMHTQESLKEIWDLNPLDHSKAYKILSKMHAGEDVSDDDEEWFYDTISKNNDKHLKENNLNPYDKIGAMMAKKMGIKQPFKKKDSRTNTIEQVEIDEDAQEEKKFKIPTLDTYQKASQHVPDHPLTSVKKKKVNEEELREVEALKDVKAKEALSKLGVAFEFKPAKSGKNRVFITDPMRDVLNKLKEAGWEEYGRNPENTIRKFENNEKILTIYADGKELPRATLAPKNEEQTAESFVIRKVVPNSINPYLKS